MQQKLIDLCAWLEVQVRPLGYHVAATGSSLYGLSEHEPEDLDVIVYKHSGWNPPLAIKRLRPFDLLQAIGFRGVDDLSLYPEFEGDRTQRCVLGVTPNSTIGKQKVGVKIDFLFIDVETDKRGDGSRPYDPTI